MELTEQLALAEQPFGLELLPDHTIFEYRDPRNEDATVARWKPTLDRFGIDVLGVRDIPSGQTRFTVDGIEWDLRVLNGGVHSVPSPVYHRIRSAEAAGIPFGYWIWGEEQFSQPTFVPDPGLARTSRTPVPAIGDERDPILIGVIPTAPNRGVWCKLGAWFH